MKWKADNAEDSSTAVGISTPIAPEARVPSVREARQEDAPAIHALLAEVFPEVSRDQERWLRRWRWQYRDNPWRKGRPCGWVLADGDGILGHLGAVYLPWRCGSQLTTGIVGADYAVAEGVRSNGSLLAGLDLARAFFAAAEDSVPMATTANEKTGAVFGRFGCEAVDWTREFWRAPATLTQEVRSCWGGSGRLSRWLVSGRPAIVMVPMIQGLHRLLESRPSVPVPRGWTIRVGGLELLESAMGAWLPSATTTACEGVGVHRSAEYTDWRYRLNPDADDLRVLLAHNRGGHVVGALIILLDDGVAPPRAWVEDLVDLTGGISATKALLCAALQVAHDEGATYLATMTGTRAMRPVFWELDFESRARSAPAAVIGNRSASSAQTAGMPRADALADRLRLWHGEMF